MTTVLHPADSRGFVDKGWLQARYSFSFANYYRPDRVNFGLLRVFNDDSVNPRTGFQPHPHENMEIVTIVLQGTLHHKDNLGNDEVLRAGDYQVMSAGSGMYHSEFNSSHSEVLRMLQIWIFPNQKNVEPRYRHGSIHTLPSDKGWRQLIAPRAQDCDTWLHQEMWMHRATLTAGDDTAYGIKGSDTGVYVFVISGAVEIAGHVLHKRDAIGITDTERFSIKVLQNADLLLIEVPMG